MGGLILKELERLLGGGTFLPGTEIKGAEFHLHYII